MASAPYFITSGLLHVGYNIFLARSYRTGDLSQVYPIARGTAPLILSLPHTGREIPADIEKRLRELEGLAPGHVL